MPAEAIHDDHVDRWKVCARRAAHHVLPAADRAVPPPARNDEWHRSSSSRAASSARSPSCSARTRGSSRRGATGTSDSASSGQTTIGPIRQRRDDREAGQPPDRRERDARSQLVGTLEEVARARREVDRGGAPRWDDDRHVRSPCAVEQHFDVGGRVDEGEAGSRRERSSRRCRRAAAAPRATRRSRSRRMGGTNGEIWSTGTGLLGRRHALAGEHLAVGLDPSPCTCRRRTATPPPSASNPASRGTSSRPRGRARVRRRCRSPPGPGTALTVAVAVDVTGSGEATIGARSCSPLGRGCG